VAGPWMARSLIPRGWKFMSMIPSVTTNPHRHHIDIRDSALRNVSRAKRETSNFVQMACMGMVM
jgi:hypothetical protein